MSLYCIHYQLIIMSLCCIQYQLIIISAYSLIGLIIFSFEFSYSLYSYYALFYLIHLILLILPIHLISFIHSCKYFIHFGFAYSFEMIYSSKHLTCSFFSAYSLQFCLFIGYDLFIQSMNNHYCSEHIIQYYNLFILFIIYIY